MRKSKTKDSKYPEDDRDLKVYEDWEAGPAHYDFRNKKRYDNRSEGKGRLPTSNFTSPFIAV